MAISNIEKQQAKLEKLNEKIKQEKKKVEQRLGHEIIKGAELDYADLDQETIKGLSDKIVTYLSQHKTDNTDNSETTDPIKQEHDYPNNQG